MCNTASRHTAPDSSPADQVSETRFMVQMGVTDRVTVSHPRGYHQAAPPPFGTSPQQQQQSFHRQQRSGSNTYSRNNSAQGQQQTPSSTNVTRPSTGQNRGPETSDEVK